MNFIKDVVGKSLNPIRSVST